MRTLQRKRAWDLIGGIALLVLALALVAGCGSGGSAATTQAPGTASTAAPGAATTSGELPVVTMQSLNGGLGPMLLKAIETAKLDEKHGFKAKITLLDPDAATNAFLLKQSVISVDIDILGVAIARNAGHMVASFYPGLNNNSSIIVKAGSSYQSPKDLVGKKVGQFGSDSGTTAVMTVLLKQLYNIDINKDFSLVTAGPGALIDLLNAGEVEAIFDFSPYTEKATALSNDRVLFCAAQSGAYAPPLVTVAAYEDWLKSNKQLAYAVRAAVDDAYHMFADSKYALLGEEPYRTLLNQSDAKVVDAVIARANEIPLMTNTWTADTRTQAQTLLQYMGDNKILLTKAPAPGSVIALEDFLGPEGK